VAPVSGPVTSISQLSINDADRYLAFKSFGTQYASSLKEPDQCVIPAGMSLPTLVVERGWSESRAHLHHDRDLWLIGGAGSVQVVLVIKWAKNAAKQVKGDIEVFDLDPFGNVQTLQREVSCKLADIAIDN